MPRYLIERSFPDGLSIPMNDEGVWMGDSRLEAGMRCYVTRTFAKTTDEDASVTNEMGCAGAQ